MGVLAGCLAGCPSELPPDAAVVVADSGAGGADSGLAAVVDAGPPEPVELQVIVTAQLEDGGVEIVSGGQIDPVKELAVWIPVSLPDYRLRVFDEADRVVPSDDRAREVDGGLDYQITLVEPLRTGRSYRITVEAQLGSALDGFKDAEVQMKVRGDVQPEPKKTPGKKKKR